MTRKSKSRVVGDGGEYGVDVDPANARASQIPGFGRHPVIRARTCCRQLMWGPCDAPNRFPHKKLRPWRRNSFQGKPWALISKHAVRATLLPGFGHPPKRPPIDLRQKRPRALRGDVFCLRLFPLVRCTSEVPSTIAHMCATVPLFQLSGPAPSWELFARVRPNLGCDRPTLAVERSPPADGAQVRGHARCDHNSWSR